MHCNAGDQDQAESNESLSQVLAGRLLGYVDVIGTGLPVLQVETGPEGAWRATHARCFSDLYHKNLRGSCRRDLGHNGSASLSIRAICYPRAARRKQRRDWAACLATRFQNTRKAN